uniref:Uncharacterized protein n=1 Tax=Ignisphaera aggregans TaxID=334771 RepID=A0A7C4NKR7_9CREN
MDSNAATTGWLMRCTACDSTWVLEVSFDIRDTKSIYHYCTKCKRNTFHEVLMRVENKVPQNSKHN